MIIIYYKSRLCYNIYIHMYLMYLSIKFIDIIFWKFFSSKFPARKVPDIHRSDPSGRNRVYRVQTPKTKTS